MTTATPRVRDYFFVDQRGSKLWKEAIAGFATYLSLSYIFIVNPAILHKAGMDVSAVLFATAIASGLTTIIMGIWARLPFVVAPGLETNGFFAFVAVAALSSWEQALGAVFLAGLICAVLTLLPIFPRLIDGIPNGLKSNIGVSVGVFVATTGLYLAKIVAFNGRGLPDFHHLSYAVLVSKEAFVLYAGFAAAAILGYLRVFGHLLIAIIAGAVLCAVFQIHSGTSAQLSPQMFSATFKLDLASGLLNPQFWRVVIVLVIITFFGAIGKSIGLTAATNLQTYGKLKDINKAVLVNGLGSVAGALTGTSSLIIYVESAVGIASGGRTGITAIVAGLLMLGSVFLTPAVGVIPVEATAGVLVFVGYLLLPRRQSAQGATATTTFDFVVAAIMGGLSFATFSLDKAMLVGFVLYSVRNALIKTERKNYFLWSFAALLVMSVVFQYIEGANH